MLPNSQPVQATTRLPGAASQVRKFHPLNASTLNENETDIEMKSAVNLSTEDSADAQLAWTNGSAAVTALYAPAAVAEVGLTGPI